MDTSLSICIPTFNRAEILRRTLAHLATQQPLFQEVVICDNHSSDRTEEVVRDAKPLFDRLVYIRHAENIGLLRNLNAALSGATCTHQYLLCDDDRLLPDGIRAGLDALSADPEAVAAFGGYEAFERPGQPPVLRPASETRVRYTLADRLEMAKQYNHLWLPILKTEAFQRHGYYAADMFGHWRLIGQLLKAGSVWVLPDYFYQHVSTPGSAENDMLEAWYLEFHRSDLELYMGELDLPAEAAQIVSKFVADRMAETMKSGLPYARDMTRPLTERTVLLRLRACGGGLPDFEREWEQRGLMTASLQRLIEQIGVSGKRRVAIESGTMNLAALVPALAAALPDVAIRSADWAELVAAGFDEADMIVAETWSLFERRQADGVETRGVGRIAWMDLIRALKLVATTGPHVLRGPSGSLHVIGF